MERKDQKDKHRNGRKRRRRMIKKQKSWNEPMWPDLVKFCHFGKSLQVLGNISMVYFLFGKILSLLFQICDIVGLIFSVANGQILKNNLTIWSHLNELSWKKEKLVSTHSGRFLCAEAVDAFSANLCLSVLLKNRWFDCCAQLLRLTTATGGRSLSEWPDWAIYWTLGNFL